MRIIKIEALENGGHQNQTGTLSVVPEGWAVIPEDMVCENFPFGDVEVELFPGQPIYEEVDGEQVVVGYTPDVPTVVKWTPGESPKPEPEPEPEPTVNERVAALEEALDLLLSGVTE